MLVVNVEIRVKMGMADGFIRATSANVEQSRCESGIAAFDLLVDPNDGHHFLLVEAYKTLDAPAAHKQTPHYNAWRDAVEPMMQVARSSTKWHRLTP
jgi:(4S)-4-hydroxy-5-phosphonooxypentane-2,3-dione isomerase